ncbi:hypothetical protein C8R45DRAFT_1081856 [Mycena sanguinolenta]|nr:hypothetical protein C8R45DRAFT_1081856 [Mycena sanguinolenta]
MARSAAFSNSRQPKRITLSTRRAIMNDVDFFDLIEALPLAKRWALGSLRSFESEIEAPGEHTVGERKDTGTTKASVAVGKFHDACEGSRHKTCRRRPASADNMASTQFLVAPQNAPVSLGHRVTTQLKSRICFAASRVQWPLNRNKENRDETWRLCQPYRNVSSGARPFNPGTGRYEYNESSATKETEPGKESTGLHNGETRERDRERREDEETAASQAGNQGRGYRWIWIRIRIRRANAQASSLVYYRNKMRGETEGASESAEGSIWTRCWCGGRGGAGADTVQRENVVARFGQSGGMGRKSMLNAVHPSREPTTRHPTPLVSAGARPRAGSKRARASRRAMCGRARPRPLVPPLRLGRARWGQEHEEGTRALRPPRVSSPPPLRASSRCLSSSRMVILSEIGDRATSAVCGEGWIRKRQLVKRDRDSDGGFAFAIDFDVANASLSFFSRLRNIPTFVSILLTPRSIGLNASSTESVDVRAKDARRRTRAGWTAVTSAKGVVENHEIGSTFLLPLENTATAVREEEFGGAHGGDVACATSGSSMHSADNMRGNGVKRRRIRREERTREKCEGKSKCDENAPSADANITPTAVAAREPVPKRRSECDESREGWLVPGPLSYSSCSFSCASPVLLTTRRRRLAVVPPPRRDAQLLPFHVLQFLLLPVINIPVARTG